MLCSCSYRTCHFFFCHFHLYNGPFQSLIIREPSIRTSSRLSLSSKRCPGYIFCIRCSCFCFFESIARSANVRTGRLPFMCACPLVIPSFIIFHPPHWRRIVNVAISALFKNRNGLKSQPLLFSFHFVSFEKKKKAVRFF